VNARRLTHATNGLLVVVVGMAAAHLLMPTRATATLAARAAFGGVLLLAGVIAGWRERAILVDERGVAPGPPALWMAGGAASTLALAALAWLVVHG
jgi:hypothetical protein